MNNTGAGDWILDGMFGDSHSLPRVSLCQGNVCEQVSRVDPPRPLSQVGTAKQRLASLSLRFFCMCGQWTLQVAHELSVYD